MVKVIERPRWSFWRYQQIYQFDLPDHCSRPVDKVADFFRQYRGRDWEIQVDEPWDQYKYPFHRFRAKLVEKDSAPPE